MEVIKFNKNINYSLIQYWCFSTHRYIKTNSYQIK